jgi:hypothetical protein
LVVVDSNNNYVGPLLSACPGPGYGNSNCYPVTAIKDPVYGIYTVALNPYFGYFSGSGEYLITVSSSGTYYQSGNSAFPYTNFSIFWTNPGCSGTPYSDVPAVTSNLGVTMAMTPYGTNSLALVKPNQPNLGSTAYQSYQPGGGVCSNIGVALIYNAYVVSLISPPFAWPLHADLR